jgi:hypothetical protein
MSESRNVLVGEHRSILWVMLIASTQARHPFARKHSCTRRYFHSNNGLNDLLERGFRVTKDIDCCSGYVVKMLFVHFDHSQSLAGDLMPEMQNSIHLTPHEISMNIIQPLSLYVR